MFRHAAMCKKSYENGENKGLGLIPFEVVEFKKNELNGLKNPHIGFNLLKEKEFKIIKEYR